MCMTKLQNNDTATFECIINISKAVATTGIICRTDLIHLQVTIHYLVRDLPILYPVLKLYKGKFDEINIITICFTFVSMYENLRKKECSPS